MSEASSASTHYPWTNPWVWLIIAIPGFTVVAGIATLMIAIEHKDVVVTSDLNKVGKMVIEANDSRSTIQSLGGRYTLSVAPGGHDSNAVLVVNAPHSVALDSSIRIHWRHPTHAEFDGESHLTLVQGDEDNDRVYTGAVNFGVSADYYLVIESGHTQPGWYSSDRFEWNADNAGIQRVAVPSDVSESR